MSESKLSTRILDSVRTIHDFPKPGIAFKDISTLLLEPALCQDVVDDLANAIHGKADAIVGIESRGFLFGLPVALQLGIPFIMVRKKGKLPGDTETFSYDLEYGSSEIEVQKDAIQPGMRVHIHDDLLATGGTALAAASLCGNVGAEVAGFSFILGLDALNGEEKLTPTSRNIAILSRC